MNKSIRMKFIILAASILMVLPACMNKRKPIAEAVPGNASQVVVIPQIAAVTTAVDDFIKAFFPESTGKDLASFKNSLSVKYGIDPTSSGSFEALGLDVKSQVAFYKYSSGATQNAVAVLPVNNEKKFNEQIALLTGRINQGVALKVEKAVAGNTFQELVVEGKNPVFYLVKGGYAYVTNSEDTLPELSSFLNSSTGRQLKDLLKYQDLTQRIAPHGLFYVFSSDDMPFTNKLNGVVDGALLDFVPTGHGFSLEGELQFGIASAAGIKKFISAGKIGDAINTIPEDSLIYALGSFDLNIVEGLIAESLKLPTKQVNEILVNLEGPYSASVKIGDVAKVFAKYQSDIVRKFDKAIQEILLINLVGQVKDQATFASSLDTMIANNSEKLGVAIDKEVKDSTTIYRLSSGEVGLALVGKRVVYSVGSGYVDQLMDAKWRPAEEIRKELKTHDPNILEKQGVVARLQFSSIADLISSGDIEAFKPARGGPSLVAKIAELVRLLDNITLSLTNEERGDSCHVQLTFSYHAHNANSASSK